MKDLIYLMSKLGIWTGSVEEPKTPIISKNEEAGFINEEAFGVFVPSIKHGDNGKCYSI